MEPLIKNDHPFSHALESLMRQHGMDVYMVVDQLETKAGLKVRKDEVSRWRNGKPPKHWFKTVMALALIFDCDPCTFFTAKITPKRETLMGFEDRLYLAMMGEGGIPMTSIAGLARELQDRGLTGVDRKNIYSWCHGSLPRNAWEILPVLADALGVRLEDIVPNI